jgi:hypothetical protein
MRALLLFVLIAATAHAQPVLRASATAFPPVGVSVDESHVLTSGFWPIVRADVSVVVVNTPPVPGEIVSPPDGTELVLDDLDLNAPLTVSWTAGADADGDALAYRWQLAPSADFGARALDEDAGAGTSITTTLAAILAATSDVPEGDTTTVYHRVVTTDGQASATSSARLVLVRLGNVAAEGGGPAELALHPPRPNPFGARATLAYALPAPGPVRLALLDVLGREVAVVVDADKAAGRHEVALDAAALPAGVYVVRLEAGTERLTRTVTRLR